MRMSSDLERMGDLARHIAKVARLRYPDSAVPPALSAHILQMGQIAERIVAKAGSVIASMDTTAALSLEQRRRRDGRAAPRSCSTRSCTTRRTSARHRDRGRPHPARAATTSGSPTTRSRWRSASSTWSPGSTAASWTCRSSTTRSRRTRGSHSERVQPLATLVGHRCGGLGGRFRVEVATAGRDRPEAVVELVDQRHTGRDVERGDVVVADPVEMLDERAERVAVRGDENDLAGAQVRPGSRSPSKASSARRRP